MQTADLFGVAIVPAIMGLVQVGRFSGLPSHLAPLVSVALGIGAGVALQVTVPGANLTGPLIVQGIVGGISFGLAASGLFSAVAKWTQPQMLSGQGLPFFGPVLSSGPMPQQTVTSGSQPGFPPSNSVPEPPPPIVP